MKNVLAYMMILCLGILSVSAQSEDKAERREDRLQKRELRKEFNESLSEKQKVQLEYQKQLRKEHRKVFEATYTEEQLAIFKNKDLSRRGKHKALKQTLSDDQKQMRKSHKEVMEVEKTKFEASLNDEQLEKYGKIKKKKRKRGSHPEKGRKNDR